MVDTDKIKELKQWQEDNRDYPFFLQENVPEIMTALGDDEDNIISFISESEQDTRRFVSQVAEELCDKFNSDSMNEAIELLMSA